MSKKQEMSLLHITAQYVAEVQAGQQPRLSDYLARYPRYADAIADFVAYYHAVEERTSSEDIVVSTDAINLVPTSHAINCDLPYDEEQEELRGMTTLLTTATGQRFPISQLAAELDLTVDIILLLEQRAIAPATIPHVLYEQIAMLLQRPSTEVQEYLGCLDQRQSRSALPKSKQQTKVAEQETDYRVSHVVDKPSFRAIVETSLQLSTEQRSRWCAVLDSQNLRA